MSNYDACNKCFEGFTLKNNNECIKITILHCKTMESAEICFECEEHYGLNTEKTECGTIDHCKTMINNTHC